MTQPEAEPRPVCGNGIVEGDEECDDGNVVDDDGCAADCTSETGLPVCGNGEVEAGEDCDDGNTDPGDGCDPNCREEAPGPVCGNGTVEDGEECDDGNTDPGDGCDADCQTEEPGPACGDGTVDDGEECDDGNNDPGDGCDADCQLEPACGDGTVDDGEECDDGNTDPGDGCDADCAFEPFCGDGTLDDGEECDDGNTDPGDGCDADCVIESEPECGNGAVEGDEECDDGNLLPGDGCAADCTTEIACLIIDDCNVGQVCVGEICVDAGECGNDVLEGAEQCDDGNTDNGDGCDEDCQIEPIVPVCGNGVVEEGEECDDGNLLPGDGCDALCAIEPPAPECGNGALEEGELCDDGNLDNGDGCDENCAIEPPLPVCGDGNLEGDEQCDDGNLEAGDGCDPLCQIEAECGNGEVEGDEQCDDGNLDAGDGCDALCAFEQVCGNGEVEGIEECDDANLDDGDGCDSFCTGERYDIIVGADQRNGATPAMGSDLYAFVVDHTQSQLVVSTSGCDAPLTDTFLTLLAADENGEPGAAIDTDDDGGEGLCSQITADLDAGLYFIQANGFVGSPLAAYGLDFRLTVEVSNPGDYNGAVAAQGNDLYVFTVAEAGEYAFFTGDGAGGCPAGDTRMFLFGFDENGERGQLAFNDDGGFGLCSRIQQQFEPGNYEIEIDGFAARAHPGYILSVAIAGECGNAELNLGEQCDPGPDVPDDFCDAECQFLPGCGNGRLDPDEQCDPGPDDPDDFCDEACLFIAGCGNGRLDEGEECDDGNLDNGDGCDDQCIIDLFDIIDGIEQRDGGFAQDGVDTYRFVVDHTQSHLTVGSSDGMAGCPGDTVFTLFAADENGAPGAEIANDDDGGFDVCSLIDMDLDAGTYFLQVAGLGGAAIEAYTLDYRLEVDVNAGGDYDGSTQAQGDDLYVLTLAADTRVRLETSDGDGGCPGDTRLFVFGDDENGERAQLFFNDDGGAGLCSLIEVDLPAGTYEIIGDGFAGRAIDAYTLSVTFGGECGDGSVDLGEECDDGNIDNGDGCDENCAIEPGCGNGQLDEGEECDDGNILPGDGCDPLCQREQVCGDGFVDAPEQCDDGNVEPGDGCDALCAFESECGNGEVEGLEGCDDGNLLPGDGCDPLCQLEPGCGNGQIDPLEECDDGNLNPNDTCDANCVLEPATEIAVPAERIELAGSIDEADSQWGRASAGCQPTNPADHFYEAFRIVNNTGADQLLTITASWLADGYLHVYREPPTFNPANYDNCVAGDDDFFIAPGPQTRASQLADIPIAAGEVLVVVASTFAGNAAIGDYTIDVLTQFIGVCGDGDLNEGEECDDGNLDIGDGCDETCAIEPGCGNGQIDDGEQCDDGNLDNGDGCDDACQREQVCGDGFVDDPEQCDDGNIVPGDGCAADCTFEQVCGNGEVEGAEQCDDGNLVDGDGCDSLCTNERYDIITGIDSREGSQIPLAGMDLYAFTVDHTQSSVTVSTNGCGLGTDTLVRIWTADENGDPADQLGEDDDGGEGFCSLLALDLDAGNYLVQVVGFAGRAVGPHGLDFRLETDVSAPGDFDGAFVAQGDDLFVFDLAEGGNVRLATGDGAGGCPAGDTIITVFGFDENGERQQVARNDDGPGLGLCSLVDAPFEAGSYEVVVNGFAGRAHDGYILTVSYGVAECGNGEIEPPEQCDDGNLDPGDGCDAECNREQICGDGVVDAPEECDDGNLDPGDGCAADCTIEPGCGNGQLDDGEQCDDGNLDPGDGCDALCQFEQRCGNGEVEGLEECDDGNVDNGDGCDAACTTEDFDIILGIDQRVGGFGQGAVDNFRFTVDHTPSSLTVQTSDGAGGCPDDTVIEIVALDENGTPIDPPIAEDDDGGVEVCSLIDALALDAGDYLVRVRSFDGGAIDAYTLDFRLETDVSAGGDFNGAYAGGGDDLFTLTLDADTTVSFATGDGDGGCPAGTDTLIELFRIDENGARVDPVSNDDAGGTLCSLISADLVAGTYELVGGGFGATDSDGYILTVSFAGVCGDGEVNIGEECDDGNLDDGDGCAADCTIEPACGNGNLDEGETCDDGNLDPGDGCDANCQIETECGNGVVEPGEQCDDGNLNNADGCDALCTFEVVQIIAGVEQHEVRFPAAGLDRFLFTVDHTQSSLRVETSDGAGGCEGIGDTIIRLFAADENGVEIGGLIASNNDGGAGLCSLLTQDLDAGNYLVQVREVGNDAEITNRVLDFRLETDVSGGGDFNGASLPRGNDLFSFTLDADDVVTLLTNDGAGACPGVDTVMDLYSVDANGDRAPVASNDDGLGLCSLISEDLVAGDYEVEVRPFGGNALDGYVLTVTIGVPPVCGDNNVDAGEECDDGNLVNGDGCDDQCQIEVLPPACGDGNVDPGEQCDDGNLANGDGCDDACQFEQECGNGAVEGNEECDDGNLAPGDGCDEACSVELVRIVRGVERHPVRIIQGRADRYLFTVDNTLSRLTAETSDGNGGCAGIGDTIMRVYAADDAGNVIGMPIATDDDSGAEFCSLINIDLDAGTYLVDVREFGGDAPIDNRVLDFRLEVDVSIGGEYNGATALGGNDLFSLTLDADATVSFETSDGAGGCPDDTLMTLFSVDVDGNRAEIGSDDDGGTDLCSLLADQDLAAGDYEVEVNGFNDAQTDPYIFTVTFGGPAVCGNGLVEAGEECDDGNLDPGDGCSPVCTNEPPPAVCGNGILEAPETCDDGNLINGDGCDDQCNIEPPVPACGDGNLDAGEECDDGNVVPGDGCAADCTIEGCAPEGFAGPELPPIFGTGGDADWFIDAEAASSGIITHNEVSSLFLAVSTPAGSAVSFRYRVSSENTFDWLEFYVDGVRIDRWSGEVDWTPVEFALDAGDHVLEWRYDKDGSVSNGEDRGLIDDLRINDADPCVDAAQPVCGNTVTEGDEECDDGNLDNGDGCADDCTIEPDPVCGDGNLEDPEECDDGNLVNGDGCADDCTIEPFCGDGAVDPGEECDDGNLDNGDGCDAACTIEDFAVITAVYRNQDSALAAGATDNYRFTLDDNGGQVLAITGDGTPNGLGCNGVGDTFLELYPIIAGARGPVIASDNDSGVGLCSRIIFGGLPAGDYEFVVHESGDDAAIGAYTIDIFVAVNATDFGQFAGSLPVGGSDGFIFELADPQNILMFTSDGADGCPLGADTVLRLFGINPMTGALTPIARNDDGGDRAFCSQLQQDLEPGRYAAIVTDLGDNDAIPDYTFEIECTDCAPGAVPPAADSLAITEIMQNPAVVGDAFGEWFEILNLTAQPIDLNGITIRDLDPANPNVHVVDAPGLVIPPGGFMVFGRNGDEAVNGGVVLDYVYADFFLANGPDEVELALGDVIIDTVSYDGGPGWPDPNGASMQLGGQFDPRVVDNDDGANWCEGDQPFGAGDLGTPGERNTPCAVVPPPPRIFDIAIRNFQMQPDPVNIPVGTTVRWTNFDPQIHTATSGNPNDLPGAGAVFDSGNLALNETFEFTFDNVGQFEYFCRPHRGFMNGYIINVEPVVLP